MREKNQELQNKKIKIATPRNIILAFGLLLMGAGFLFLVYASQLMQAL